MSIRKSDEPKTLCELRGSLLGPSWQYSQPSRRMGDMVVGVSRGFWKGLMLKKQECGFESVNMCPGRHVCTPFLHPGNLDL